MRRSTMLVFGLALLSRPLSAAGPEASPTPEGGWKPFDLGAHSRPVSTGNPGAQLAFDQGLNFSFAFNHEEAERAFREAARRDPGLAMAWWGVALVNGPHINNPSVDDAHAKVAWEALAEAKKRVGEPAKSRRPSSKRWACATRCRSPRIVRRWTRRTRRPWRACAGASRGTPTWRRSTPKR